MPTLGSVMTLRDLALNSQLGNDELIVEYLSKSTPLLEDMLFKNGNQIDGHSFQVRSGLPAVGFRSINQGVLPTRGSVSTQRVT